jgi:hypothetical protein
LVGAGFEIFFAESLRQVLVPESWRNTQAVETIEELKAGALAYSRVKSAR